MTSMISENELTRIMNMTLSPILEQSKHDRLE
jgi:hypothetical protein